MAIRALAVDNSNVQVLLAPGVYTTDQLSTVLDMQGASECRLLVVVGTAGITLDSSNYINLELQDSDDDTTYAAVSDAHTYKPAAGAAASGNFGKLDSMSKDNLVYKTAYKGGKRYLKVNVNFVGTHGVGTPLCVLAEKLGGGVPVA